MNISSRQTFLKCLTFLALFSFLAFSSSFAAYKAKDAKKKHDQMVKKLSDQTPVKSGAADEFHNYTTPSPPVGTQSLGFEESTPANPISAMHPPIGNPSPGWQVGITTHDQQTIGSTLRRVDWRGTAKLVKFAWTKKENFGPPYDGRRITYQAYDPNTGAFTQTTGGSDIHAVLGQVSDHVTLDVHPDGRAVLATNYSPTGEDFNENTYVWTEFAPTGGYFGPWKCTLPDTALQYWLDPQNDYRYLWPSADFQVDEMDTVLHVFAQQSKTGDGTPQRLMYFRKIGSSSTCYWDFPPLKVDIAQDLAQVVTASRVSRKVAIIWTAGYTSPPGDTITPDRGQLLNDVFYKINTDMGAMGSWGPTINVTRTDSSQLSWMAQSDLSALYGTDDFLHIVWNARQFDFYTQTFPMLTGSRIFHYSNLNPGVISVVKDANWDITENGANNYPCTGGAWNVMSLVKMSISECDGKFYCLFTQYNDYFNGVTDDCHNANWSANYGSGTANGELYISISRNGGRNWDIARNLTNSYSPHCDSAVALGGTLECQSDMWATMSRFGMNSAGLNFTAIPKVDPSGGSYVGSSYLDVFYVNDKYPGSAMQDQGVWTTNPMRWFRVPCVEPVDFSLLSLSPAAIQDPAWVKPMIEKDTIVRLENIGNLPLNISYIGSHRITGPEDWLGIDLNSAIISDGYPNFVNLTVKLNKEGHVTSGPKGYDGFIEFISDAYASPDTLFIHLIIADTVQFPDLADIRTASKRIAINNAGNLGDGGKEGYTLDFFNDCDTANNVAGSNDNARIYLYDASPFVLRISGTDTTLNNYIWNSDWLYNDGFRPTKGLTVDSSGTNGYNYARTGKFLTRDSVIGLECEYFMPTSPDTSDFMVQRVKVFKNVPGGDAIPDVMIGELMDWDIPSDSGVDNGSGYDAARRLMYCYGAEYGADTGALSTWNDCILANDRAGGFSYWRGYKIAKNQPAASTDTIPMKGIFTGSNRNWQGPTGNFPPGNLYQKLWNNGILFSGYEPWEAQTADPDSIYVDLNMVAFFGNFTLAPTDTLIFVKILATTKDQLTKARPLSKIIDEARAWIQGRRGLSNCCNLPGDANNDGRLNALDAAYLIRYLFCANGPRPPCRAEGDPDGNGTIHTLDITRIINKLYNGGAALVCPR